MSRRTIILILVAIVLGLPYAFRRPAEATDWQSGDPAVVIVTPNNEAIRDEVGRAFATWHRTHFGRTAKVDWRTIGGATEITRYLVSAYVAAARAWWTGAGHSWPAGASDAVCGRALAKDAPPAIGDLYKSFRATDDPHAFSSGVDLYFGGGSFDHLDAYQQGLTVPPWTPGNAPSNLFYAADGTELIPERVSGDTWRTATMFGCVLSTFGIVYNLDRLQDLRVAHPPRQWDDLADPVYVGQVGVADPTKSGSVAKTFEIMIHQKCHEAVAAAGFTATDVDGFEQAIRAFAGAPGALPPSVPANYQAAVELGWLDGVRLVQRIGANARYFTDAGSRIPLDVSVGDAAVGIAIDFYGRFQAQSSRSPDGRERMVYVTPVGGSVVGCDPISLLRGAENRETAIHFVEFILSEDGQRLWNYRPGAPGGPQHYALRRLPIRRDFYPPATNHLGWAVDDLADPAVNPYALAENFIYRSRWTAPLFGVQRDLVKAMCIDSADELRAAWKAILTHGGPRNQTAAVEQLARLPDVPEPLTWRSAGTIMQRYNKIEVMRQWTLFFRASYREAQRIAEGGGGHVRS